YPGREGGYMGPVSPSAVLGRLLRWGAAVGLLLCLAGLLGPGRSEGLPRPGGARGRVYLIRGQGWVFSGGWAALRERLRDAGLEAEDLSDHAGGRAADEVLADQGAGRLAGPVVLVGHSRGGRQALAAAERLGRAGIPVDLLLTVD